MSARGATGQEPNAIVASLQRHIARVTRKAHAGAGVMPCCFCESGVDFPEDPYRPARGDKKKLERWSQATGAYACFRHRILALKGN